MTAASELIADARGYVSDLVAQSSQAMSDAISAVQAVGFIRPEVVKVDMPEAPASFLEIAAPELIDVPFDPPAAPGEIGNFTPIPTFDASGAPTLTVSVPSLVMPSSPSALPGFTQVLPSINTSVAFPEPPAQLVNPLLPDPVLVDRVAPTAPTVVIPGFTALAPTDLPVAPDALESRFDSAYRGATTSTVAALDGFVDAFIQKHNPEYFNQMARLESQLVSMMNGEAGFTSAAENQYYERARAKTLVESQRVRDDVYSEGAARGFKMPTGMMASAMQGARQAAADTNVTAAREILVMQVELQQKNLQFAITTSASLRASMLQAALSYHQNLVSINGQALDYAKSSLGFVIEAYNTAVKVYGLRLDLYRAQAAVYETQLKGAMAAVELYQAEIQALQALTNVDRAKVDVYRARVDALSSLSNMYKAQIDAVLGRASLEKMKIDLFQAQTQAYSSLVQSKNAEWQGYQAAIEGQLGQVKIYSAQVDAFSAQLNGWKATIEAKSSAVQAAATANDAVAREYSARMQGYSAVVQASSEVARTKLENQRQKVVAFQATMSGKVAQAQYGLSYYEAVARIGQANAQLQMTTQVTQAEYTKAYSATIAQLGTANAQVFSGGANAALSGMNSLAAESASTSS